MRLMLLLVFSLGMSVANASGSERLIVYQALPGLFGGEGDRPVEFYDLGFYTFDLDSGYVTATNTELPFGLCPDESEYLCVTGTALKFSVPRSGLEAGAEWEFGDRTYLAERRRTVTLMGATFSGWDITAQYLAAPTSDKIVYHYFFSYEAGLMLYQEKCVNCESDEFFALVIASERGLLGN